MTQGWKKKTPKTFLLYFMVIFPTIETQGPEKYSVFAKWKCYNFESSIGAVVSLSDITGMCNFVLLM